MISSSVFSSLFFLRVRRLARCASVTRALAVVWSTTSSSSSAVNRTLALIARQFWTYFKHSTDSLKPKPAKRSIAAVPLAARRILILAAHASGFGSSMAARPNASHNCASSLVGSFSHKSKSTSFFTSSYLRARNRMVHKYNADAKDSHTRCACEA